MKTIEDISKKILETLKSVGKTEYFTIYSVKGKEVKIRVGNHSGNNTNNATKTLSFISSRSKQKKSAYNAMITEWVVDVETGLTDTYQTIEEVLDWEDISDNQEDAETLYFEQ